MGSVVLCAALSRSTEDGYTGKYYGTDINPDAGYFLQPPYSEYGQILYGDSIKSLETCERTIAGRMVVPLCWTSHSHGTSKQATAIFKLGH